MKQIVAFFLFMVLSVQLLPIKAMGKCLYNNVFTEEQCVTKFISSKNDADTVVKLPFLSIINDKDFHFELTISLIAEPSFAIISPPPNFIG